MLYSKQVWHDDPASDTPVSATRLGHIEDGIGAASDDASAALTAATASRPTDSAAVRAQVEAELRAGSNISISTSGSGATRILTIASTSTGGTAGGGTGLPAGALALAVVQANPDGTWPAIARTPGWCYEGVGPWHPDGSDAGHPGAAWWAPDSDAFTRTAS